MKVNGISEVLGCKIKSIKENENEIDVALSYGDYKKLSKKKSMSNIMMEYLTTLKCFKLENKLNFWEGYPIAYSIDKIKNKKVLTFKYIKKEILDKIKGDKANL